MAVEDAARRNSKSSSCRCSRKTNNTDMEIDDRIRGGLIGLLVGDALGVPYEFHPPERIDGAAQSKEQQTVSDFTVKALDESTWPDFARLVEKHNGVWGGCWCIGFHPEGFEKPRSAERNRANKERRVREGRAHAALVYDGPNAIGWCQFGPTDELERIKHKREYLSGLAELPDWRITCFFVDRDYRGRNVASVALAGALSEIARLGGGTVESYPEDVEGRRTSGSFLNNATLSIFERQGFQRTRRLGMHHWVVNKVVEGSKGARAGHEI